MPNLEIHWTIVADTFRNAGRQRDLRVEWWTPEKKQRAKLDKDGHVILNKAGAPEYEDYVERKPLLDDAFSVPVTATEAELDELVEARRGDVELAYGGGGAGREREDKSKAVGRSSFRG